MGGNYKGWCGICNRWDFALCFQEQVYFDIREFTKGIGIGDKRKTVEFYILYFSWDCGYSRCEDRRDLNGVCVPGDTFVHIYFVFEKLDCADFYCLAGGDDSFYGRIILVVGLQPSFRAGCYNIFRYILFSSIDSKEIKLVEIILRLTHNSEINFSLLISGY